MITTILKTTLLVAVVLQAATATEDHHTEAGFYDVTISVTNKLSSGMALILHCRSGDTDLGARAVEINATYGFGFGQNLFGGTYFWCDAAFRDRRLSFTAYDEAVRATFVIDFDVSDGGVDGLDVYRGGRVHVCWNR